MHTPGFIQYLFRDLTWRIPSRSNILYLTFDDGPAPGVTPFVLELLEKYQAKGTFFCVGENVARYPELYKQVLAKGHSTGNHTQHHLNGWLTSNREYFASVAACSARVNSRLFRPPYGKIRLSQARKLSGSYRIIMWDVLSRDYLPSLTGEQCAQHVIRSARPGSIVVFHDSLKAEARLRSALPLVLGHFSRQGYVFKSIPSLG